MKEAHGEFDSECPGYCGAQDTFYVGTFKGVGRIDQQTFIDTYSKVAAAKLYTDKTPITAADLLNDRVLTLFEEHDIPLRRMLTDRGTEYCGAHDRHPYELYLAVNDIEHTRTRTLDELQRDLDAWMTEYNEYRPHQGRWCYGKTPMQTFLDTVPLAQEKHISTGAQAH